MFALQVGKAQSNSDQSSAARQVKQSPAPAGDPEMDFEQESAPELEPQSRAQWNLGKIRFGTPGGDEPPQAPPPFKGKPFPHLIQTKRIVNEPGDEFELEADRVAAELMQPPNFDAEKPFAEISSPARPSGVRPPIRTRALAPPDFGMPSIVHQVLNSPGRALDPEARAFFEPRLDRDLSSVRIHTDATASLSAQSIGALAYTSGNNIAFGAGRFSPATAEGKRLLAHELTHVVQQDAAGLSIGTSRHAAPAPIQRQAAPGSASTATKSPVVKKVVAYFRSNGVAWAYLSDDSMQTVEVLKNTLDSGSYTVTPQGAASAEKDADYIQLVSSGFAWRQPVAYYEPGASVDVEIQLTPEQRIARLPDYIRAYVSRDGRKHPTEPELEKQADDGEALVRNGYTREDIALAGDPDAVIEVKSEAPALDLNNDAEVVESMRRRGFDDFPSEKKFKNQLADQIRGEKNSPAWWDEKSAAAYWKEFPEEAAKDWKKYADPKYKAAEHDDAEAWRAAFKRIDAAAHAPWEILGASAAIGGLGAVAAPAVAAWGATIPGAAAAAASAHPIALSTVAGLSLAAGASEATTGKSTGFLNPARDLNAITTGLEKTVGLPTPDGSVTSDLLPGRQLSGSERAVAAIGTALDLLGFAITPRPSAMPTGGSTPEPELPSGPQGVVPGGGQGTGVPTGELRSVGQDNTLGPVYQRPQVQDQAPTGAGAANDNVSPQPLRAVAGDPTGRPSPGGTGRTESVSAEPGSAGKVPTKKTAAKPPARPAPGTAPHDVPLSDDEMGLSADELRNKHIREHQQERQSVGQEEADREVAQEGKETGKAGAGMAAHPKHHVFPQEHRAWFEDRGFTGDHDIDEYTVEIPDAEHQAIHGGGDYRLGRTTGTDWNTNVMHELEQAEAALQPPRHLTRDEIFAIVLRQMREYGISQHFIPYE